MHYFGNFWVIFTPTALFTWPVSGQVKTRLILQLRNLQVGKEQIILLHRFIVDFRLMDYKATLQIMCALVTSTSLAFEIHNVTESQLRVIQPAFNSAD